MPSVRDLSLPAGRGNNRPLSANRVYLRTPTLLTDGFNPGHFTVRKLERIYGPGTVRRAYEEIRKGIGC
jgi:hypothetical protein